MLLKELQSENVVSVSIAWKEFLVIITQDIVTVYLIFIQQNLNRNKYIKE